jgi:hypothetical protein
MSGDTPTTRKSTLEQGYIARINQLKRTLDATTNEWAVPAAADQEPCLAAALARIARLETALRLVDKWALYTCNDITDAGYEIWSRMLPKLPQCTPCAGLGYINPHGLDENCDRDRCKVYGGTGVELNRATP